MAPYLKSNVSIFFFKLASLEKIFNNHVVSISFSIILILTRQKKMKLEKKPNLLMRQVFDTSPKLGPHLAQLMCACKIIVSIMFCIHLTYASPFYLLTLTYSKWRWLTRVIICKYIHERRSMWVNEKETNRKNIRNRSKNVDRNRKGGKMRGRRWKYEEEWRRIQGKRKTED